jgi:NAD(P)-dependent dehydrogenase (short-subunit alcohol dehydrogenase family)
MAPVTTKVALVTGAARGIGRAIALRLADDGFDIAVNDLPNTPELNGLLREIENKGRRSLVVPADVSLEPEVVKMTQDVVQKLGSLDVVSLSFWWLRGDTLRCAIDGCERGHNQIRTASRKYFIMIILPMMIR